MNHVTLLGLECSPLETLPKLSIISTIALKIDPCTPPLPPHTHTHSCTSMDMGIMGRVPMHPYFKVVSPVSLYILSCGSNTEGCSSCLNMFMLLTHLLDSHSAGCTDRAGQRLTPFGVNLPLRHIRGGCAHCSDEHPALSHVFRVYSMFFTAVGRRPVTFSKE